MKIVLIIILVLFLIFFTRWKKKYSFPLMSCVSLVTGGVKTGKSTFAVWRAITSHKSRLRSVQIYNFFHRKNKREIPYLYSNIPLKYKYYRKLTLSLILRKERFTYGSVVYVNEASLLADSFSFEDREVNEALLLFNKMFGHETLGGFLIYDTQSLADCHFAIKRCISEYINLDGVKKGFFGLKVAYRRMKMTSSTDSVDVNIFDGKDVERTMVYIPKRAWKYFDAFCFSSLTDGLPISAIEDLVKSLKTQEILSVSEKRFIHERIRLDKNNKNTEDLENDAKKVFDIPSN